MLTIAVTPFSPLQKGLGKDWTGASPISLQSHSKATPKNIGGAEADVLLWYSRIVNHYFSYKVAKQINEPGT